MSDGNGDGARSGAGGQRPPATVVGTILAAGAGALALALGAVVALALGVRWATGAFQLLALAAGLAWFAVSSVRRDRWPWGGALIAAAIGVLVALVVAAVALDRRDRDTTAIATAVAVAAALVAVAFLRRPARAWFGYACAGCGAFRWAGSTWPVRCARCGAVPEAEPARRKLPRWVYPVFQGVLALSLLVSYGSTWWTERAAARAQRERIHGTGAHIRIVGWETFGEAVLSLEGVAGVKAVPLGPGTCARSPVPEGRAFPMDAELAHRILHGSHLHFLERGVYLFRCDSGAQGDAGRREVVLALMPTHDPRAVMRRLGTGAPRSGVSPEDAVARVEALAAQASFEVWEIGIDRVVGRFDGLPADTLPLARRILELSPARRDPGDPQKLADELARDGTFELRWPDETPATAAGR